MLVVFKAVTAIFMGHAKTIVDTTTDMLTPSDKASRIPLLLFLALLAPQALLLDAELRQWLVLFAGRII